MSWWPSRLHIAISIISGMDRACGHTENLYIMAADSQFKARYPGHTKELAESLAGWERSEGSGKTGHLTLSHVTQYNESRDG